MRQPKLQEIIEIPYYFCPRLLAASTNKTGPKVYPFSMLLDKAEKRKRTKLSVPICTATPHGNRLQALMDTRAANPIIHFRVFANGLEIYYVAPSKRDHKMIFPPLNIVPHKNLTSLCCRLMDNAPEKCFDFQLLSVVFKSHGLNYKPQMSPRYRYGFKLRWFWQPRVLGNKMD